MDSVGSVVACDMPVDGAATGLCVVVGLGASSGGGPDMVVGNSGSVGNGVIGANVTGATVGRGVGGTVGRGVGDTVGKGVGDSVGDNVGSRVGANVCAMCWNGVYGWLQVLLLSVEVSESGVGIGVGAMVGRGVGASVLEPAWEDPQVQSLAESLPIHPTLETSFPFQKPKYHRLKFPFERVVQSDTSLYLDETRQSRENLQSVQAQSPFLAHKSRPHLLDCCPFPNHIVHRLVVQPLDSVCYSWAIHLVKGNHDFVAQKHHCQYAK